MKTAKPGGLPRRMFQGCPPARWTEPLSVGFDSAIDRFLPVLRIVWRVALGFEHDAWQTDVIRAVFEIDPRTGKLRWRQFLISMARQQGKSEIAAALAILMLLWKPYALVVGIASSADQARIVFSRTLRVVRAAPAFARLFRKATDTRGIETSGGGSYLVKPAKGAALQGLAIDLGVIDEVHLLATELWTALVNGTGSRDDCLVAGITTAGDADSELLKHLYELGDAGEVGFICWEAPDRQEYAAGRLPADDDVLWSDLMAAGPAYATGRTARENVLTDVRTLPPADAIRYRLNRFIAGGQLTYMAPALWAARVLPERPPIPEPGRVVFALDRTPEWSYATITAAWKDAADPARVHTEVVASYTSPNQDQLLEKCALLAKYGPRAFVMDGQQFGGLAKALKQRGVTVHTATLADVVAASSLVYSKTAKGTLDHAGDQLLTVQLPSTKRKTSGDGYKLVRTGGQIDAVYSTVLGVYFAEVLPEQEPQLFV